MDKDWTGNSNSIFATLGASNHTEQERELNDFYATEPKAVGLLLQREKFSEKIWEPACGQGHISKVLMAHGYKVLSSDLVNRGYGYTGVDFLKAGGLPSVDKCFRGGVYDIITNPPYRHALEFCKKAISLIQPNQKVAMFLRLQFLEGIERRAFFNIFPPARVYVASKRLSCAKNGDFESKSAKSNAVCYAWFVWEKGTFGEPVIRWIN